jgi:ankyrin repeat protein
VLTLNKEIQNGRSAISCAAESDNADCVELLFGKNDDVNQSDDEGRTPLSWAASTTYGGNMVKAVLSQEEPDPYSMDNLGQKPLWYALRAAEG